MAVMLDLELGLESTDEGDEAIALPVAGLALESSAFKIPLGGAFLEMLSELMLEAVLERGSCDGLTNSDFDKTGEKSWSIGAIEATAFLCCSNDSAVNGSPGLSNSSETFTEGLASLKESIDPHENDESLLDALMAD